ncbi:MAG: redoxin domain-containing protein [Patescibacteria group bacterium]
MSILNKIFNHNQAEHILLSPLPIEGDLPEFVGLSDWLNSAPLRHTDLLGKVVLIDFWTYSCVNCIRTLPQLRSWHQNYAKQGLTIVGVHTPEFEFEKDRNNVEVAVKRFGIEYPIALDNRRKTWDAFRNRYWPAHYFVDRAGKIRYHHFGEGGYRQSEQVIRMLLQEAGEELPTWTDANAADRLDVRDVATPETYLGYWRQEYFGSPEAVAFDGQRRYSVPERPAKNVFYFDGDWEIHGEFAVPKSIGARLVYRYQATEVNLVLESGIQDSGFKKNTMLEVILDNAPLNEKNAGEDIIMIDGRSMIEINEARTYGLIDGHGESDEHLLELRFPEPGIRCFVFTFG